MGITSSLRLAIQRLRKNDPSFKSLFLNDTDLTDDVARDFSSALMENTSVQQLYMALVCMSPVGAAYLCHALESNRHVESFSFNNEHSSREVMRRLPRVIEKNTKLETLHIYGSCTSEEIMLVAKAYGSNTTISSIKFWDVSSYSRVATTIYEHSGIPRVSRRNSKIVRDMWGYHNRETRENATVLLYGNDTEVYNSASLIRDLPCLEVVRFDGADFFSYLNLNHVAKIMSEIPTLHSISIIDPRFSGL